MPGDVVVSIEVDQAQIERVARSLRAVPEGAQKAISSSINRALAHGRTVISKRVRAVVNISQKAMLRVIATRKASPSRLNGQITVSREPIPLGEYKPVQTPQGVRVQVRKSRGAEEIPHAFIATMRSGHRGVFVRQVINGKRAGRLPVKQLYGPTGVGVLANAPGVLEGSKKDIGEEFVKRLDGQVARFIEQPEAGTQAG